MMASEAFALIAEVLLARGHRSIKDTPGCVEMDVGALHIALNGHEEPTPCATGTTLPPYHAMVTRGGWPLMLVSPYDGSVLGGTEDEVIAELKRVLEAEAPERLTALYAEAAQ